MSKNLPILDTEVLFPSIKPGADHWRDSEASMGKNYLFSDLMPLGVNLTGNLTTLNDRWSSAGEQSANAEFNTVDPSPLLDFAAHDLMDSRIAREFAFNTREASSSQQANSPSENPTLDHQNVGSAPMIANDAESIGDVTLNRPTFLGRDFPVSNDDQAMKPWHPETNLAETKVNAPVSLYQSSTEASPRVDIAPNAAKWNDAGFAISYPGTADVLTSLMGAASNPKVDVIGISSVAPNAFAILSQPQVQYNGSESVLVSSATGFSINLKYDAAALAAPASFRAGIQQAANILAATITDHITVNINIDYSGTGGGAAAGPDRLFNNISYSTVRADLINGASPGDTTFNALPNAPSIQGQLITHVFYAQAKLPEFGLLSANDTTTDDASAFFATDINSNLLVGVALHELTHALGRVPDGSTPDIFDLFRFTSPGTRLFLGNATAPPAYFSVDGGNTKIADYGQTSDASDFLNSGVQGPNDPFNEFYSFNTLQQLTAADLKQLDALGFHLSQGDDFVSEIVPASLTATVGISKAISGVQVVDDALNGETFTTQLSDTNGNLSATGSGVSGTGTHTLTITGTLSTVNAALATLSYNSAVAGTDSISVKTTDSDGSTVTKSIAVTISSVIEVAGLTDLVQVGSNYFLYPHGGSSGPSLKLSGAAVVAGQFGGFAPIGAEPLAGGYEIAWKVTGADQYTVWNTDSSGNYISNLIGVVSGTSNALETFETSFQQDLNGDGTIGLPPPPPPTVIEAFGTTSLVAVGNNYFLYPHGGSSGPSLKLSGMPVTAGQFGGFAPIGAEPLASGYEIAWKATGADQYTVWNTDSSGNYISNLIGVVSGTSNVLETFETSFQQDLNGDGTIGPLSQISGMGVGQATTIAAGATVEILSAYSGAVTFSGSTDTLQLDNSSSFSGTVAGLADQDTIDLRDINFASLQTPNYSGNSTAGTLSVTDGLHAANIALLGNYIASAFVASSDGHGGTMIVDPPSDALSQTGIPIQPQHA